MAPMSMQSGFGASIGSSTTQIGSAEDEQWDDEDDDDDDMDLDTDGEKAGGVSLQHGGRDCADCRGYQEEAA